MFTRRLLWYARERTIKIIKTHNFVFFVHILNTQKATERNECSRDVFLICWRVYNQNCSNECFGFLYTVVSLLVRGLSVEKLIYDSEIATQARLCMYGERSVSFVIKGREGQRWDSSTQLRQRPSFIPECAVDSVLDAQYGNTNIRNVYCVWFTCVCVGFLKSKNIDVVVNLLVSKMNFSKR